MSLVDLSPLVNQIKEFNLTQVQILAELQKNNQLLQEIKHAINSTAKK